MLLLLQLACAPCGPDRPCRVDGGEYYLALPDSGQVDGLLILFHAYGNQPTGVLGQTDEVAEIFATHTALVMPQGLDDNWNATDHRGTRDEMAFMDAVMDDVRARYDVPDSRVWATGFSVGSSVAHDLACQREWLGASAPISGVFWDPIPEACPGAPTAIRHVHGTDDGVWPFSGRSFGSATQGDVNESMDLWVEVNGCGSATVEEEDGPNTCTVWTDCSGGEVRYCLHDGDHNRRDGWAARMMGWLLTTVE